MNKIFFIGSSLGHSLLPLVYSLINEQLHLRLEVVSLEMTERQVIDFFTKKEFDNLAFFCITFPYKILAANLVNAKTAHAERSNSVNIIYRNGDGQLIGDNTDGKGFLNDLQGRLNIEINGEKVLILGDGGVSRGISYELINQDPHSVVICCRKEICCTSMGNSDDGPLFSCCSYENIPSQKYKLVINTTSASIYDTIPPLALTDEFRNAFFFECAYSRHRKTPFEEFLHANQIYQYSSGIGMLIEQAAVAIQRLYSVEINTTEIFTKLMKIIEYQGLKAASF